MSHNTDEVIKLCSEIQDAAAKAIVGQLFLSQAPESLGRRLTGLSQVAAAGDPTDRAEAVAEMQRLVRIAMAARS